MTSDSLLTNYGKALIATTENKEPVPRTSREYRPGNQLAAQQTPLVFRLKKQLDKIPEDTKAQGLLMAEIKPLCTGRYRRTTPHPGDVAKALIEMGWYKHRSWAAGATRETRWYPPQANQEKPK